MPSPGSPGPFFEAPGGPTQDGLGGTFFAAHENYETAVALCFKKGGWVIQWYLYIVR